MVNSKQAKIWGETRCIFSDNNVEIHRIKAKENGYCSVHKHLNKWNIFFVEYGRLRVTIFREDAGQKIEDVTILNAEEMTSVAPGLYHKFEALDKDTVAYEIYYNKLDSNDIERLNVGGIKIEKEEKLIKEIAKINKQYASHANDHSRKNNISDSPIYCEHANECPMICPCDKECYCYVHGNCGERKSRYRKEDK